MYFCDRTDEYSFILKPSLISGAGIGVFVTHDVIAGTEMNLFPRHPRFRRLKEDQIPHAFKGYCIAEEDDWYRCPLHFNQMEIFWYTNHSFTPNIEQRQHRLYAVRDLSVGEEILLDYNTLNEPAAKRELYYMPPA